MGKTRFYLYGVKGKVGNLVAQKSQGGGTMLREYVVPANPRTAKQNAQRIIFATVASAAKVLKPLVNHSFEGKAYGTKSVNYFRKLNLNKLRALAAIDFAESPKAADARVFMSTKGVQSLIPNSYIVSSGSLAPLKPVIVCEASVAAKDGALSIAMPRSVSLPVTVVDGVAYLSKADIVRSVYGFVANNEQLSLVSILNTSAEYQYQFGDEPVAGWQIPYTSYNVMRFVVSAQFDFGGRFRIGTAAGGTITLDEEVAQDIVLMLTSELADAAQSASLLVNAFSSFLDAALSVSVSGTTASITISSGVPFEINDLFQSPDTDYSVIAAGIIRSQLDDKSWLRSKCELVLAKPKEGPLDNFGLDWNAALQAWAEGGADIASSSEFLNEGGSENQLGEDF